MLQIRPHFADAAGAAGADPGHVGAQTGPQTPPDLAGLLAENARLREETHALRAQSFQDRQKANYYQDLHQRAKERLEEGDQQIEALKAKLAELKHRLFGRKSERRQQDKSARAAMNKTPKRPRGQQRGAPGHGRKPRTALPVVEVELDLPAPFVELDAERMATPAYQQADTLLRGEVEKLAAASQAQLADKALRGPRRKILKSLENHWHGLTLFVAHPQIPMDNNGAERAARPAAVARKNFYGSGAAL